MPVSDPRPPSPPRRGRRLATALRRWIDAGAGGAEAPPPEAGRRVDWPRILPFVALHLGCLGVFLVGVSPVAVGVAVGLYLVRMFAITGFYHRYFSHRAFKTSRAAQLVFAVVGNSAVQRGPLWWAAHHRMHHRHSDEPADVHSPHVHGFWWSHMGWITDPVNFATDLEQVPDLARYPELRFLDRFNVLVPVLLAVSLYGLGASLGEAWGTSGWQMLVWGFFLSTTVLFHATCSINSVAHVLGWRRYATKDRSRNNGWLALLTLGEGWHNNHHRYPAAERQAHRWWELDLTSYGLALLAGLGIIWDRKKVPARILANEDAR